MVKVIVAKDKIDCEHLLGQFVDESHYDVLIVRIFAAASCRCICIRKSLSLTLPLVRYIIRYTQEDYYGQGYCSKRQD